MPFQVMVGRPYWAAFGDRRWSAVQIVTIKRKWANADRVNPSSNQVTKRGARVKVTELVKRDPELKGKDKPQSPPVEVFAKVREVEKPIEPVEEETVPKPKRKLRSPESERVRAEHVGKLLGLLDDQSTVDDW
jgi:hypothetical protein